MTDYSPEQLRAQRNNYLRRTYGITIEQYEELLARQEYACKICRRHEETFAVRLAVDHDHSSGEIRGLLCRYCNHRVVGRHRDGDLLRRVAEYVSQGTGWFVPEKKKRGRNPRKRKA